MSEENNLQVSKQSDEQFCSSCGKPIKIKAEICPHCGVRQSGSKEKSEKSWMTCLLLCIFFGWLGNSQILCRKNYKRYNNSFNSCSHCSNHIFTAAFFSAFNEFNSLNRPYYDSYG